MGRLSLVSVNRYCIQWLPHYQVAMRILIDRFVRLASDERWARAKDFATVLGVVFGVLLTLVTTIMVLWYPNQLNEIRARLTAAEPQFALQERLASGIQSKSRLKANRCFMQLSEALNGQRFDEVGPAALCAEKNFLQAVDDGDALGDFGLFSLYQEDRLSGIFSHQGDLSKMKKLSHFHWCRFVTSEQAKNLEMTAAFPEIICD